MPVIRVDWLSLRLRLRDFLADPAWRGARLGQKVRSLNVMYGGKPYADDYN